MRGAEEIKAVEDDNLFCGFRSEEVVWTLCFVFPSVPRGVVCLLKHPILKVDRHRDKLADNLS